MAASKYLVICDTCYDGVMEYCDTLYTAKKDQAEHRSWYGRRFGKRLVAGMEEKFDEREWVCDVNIYQLVEEINETSKG